MCLESSRKLAILTYAPPPLKAVEAPIKIKITIPCIYGVAFSQGFFSLTLFIFSVPLEVSKDLEPGNPALQISSTSLKLLRSAWFNYRFINSFIILSNKGYWAPVMYQVLWQACGARVQPVTCLVTASPFQVLIEQYLFIDSGTILLGFPENQSWLTLKHGTVFRASPRWFLCALKWLQSLSTGLICLQVSSLEENICLRFAPLGGSEWISV